MKRILSSILVITISAAAFAQTHYAQEFLHKQPPRVPDYVAFAGDTIRFDRSDYFERMDRELVSFTYMHTNTTLMLEKSERYFSQIVPILKREGIPEDLKYLIGHRKQP